MPLETPELALAILTGPAGENCQLDPDGSPPGPIIRVLFTAPFLGVNQGTGVFENSKPEIQARGFDVDDTVVPESTVLRVAGDRDYVAERIEATAGSDVWRTLPLREV